MMMKDHDYQLHRQISLIDSTVPRDLINDLIRTMEEKIKKL